MIKRLYFKHEHGDKDELSSDSSSSSSSSDSEVEPDDTAESEGHSDAAELKQVDKSPSSSSGYESENSSADEINVDSSGCADEDDGSEKDEQTVGRVKTTSKHGAGVREKNVLAKKDSQPDAMSDYAMKFKSVYRCRLCPRIVCLTEATMKTHLSSKRHTRSEKLLKENRLKAMLNSDGEIENQETPAEMHARIMALAQSESKKKNKGRQRQKKRSRNKKNVESVERKPEGKRRKSES